MLKLKFCKIKIVMDCSKVFVSIGLKYNLKVFLHFLQQNVMTSTYHFQNPNFKDSEHHYYCLVQLVAQE